MDIKYIKDWLRENLREGRYLHSLGAEEAARELAIRFGENEDKAAIAGLVHDCAKCLPDEELYKIIEEKKLNVSKMELQSVKTLHAAVGSYMAFEKFSISNEQVLKAIRYHTIGRVGMSMIEKIVFLADKIEIKTRNKAFRDSIIKVLDETNDIDEAILICYDSTIRRLIDRKMIINPQTVDVYNSLLLRK